ncbi:MAG: alpha/beta hydrolase [Kiloniellales bacterium]|nr:alpha/beta hydrolase [Kiloniellales bacterium]
MPDEKAPAPPQSLSRDGGMTIAYHKSSGLAPGIVFLGGFMSDMTGTKATALEAYARARGRAFLRFDYRGHGQSSGDFTEGTIGLWAEDAIAALDELTEGPQVLVGSSMGGWIMLLTALARPERVAGMVGIAAAPDFTEDLMWQRYAPEIRTTLEREGIYEEPSEYSDEPYRITMKLIEDGRRHLLLRAPIPLTCPLRLIHGTADAAVPWETSLRIMERIESEDVEVTLVKEGDHRLSEPHDLHRLEAVIDGLVEKLAG